MTYPISLPDGFRHLTLSLGIRSSARRVPEKLALLHDGRALRYRDLARRMAQAANLAGGLGLGFGDRIALIAPNCLEYVEIVAGFADAGVIVATLNSRLTSIELSAIVADCSPRAIIVHPDCRHAIDPAWAGDLPVIEIGPDYEARLARASDSFAGIDLPEWHSFSISYTSGTTGMPKGVQLSHRGRALAFLMMQAEYGCFSQRDHFLAIAPQYHGAGFAFAFAPLAFGGTCTLFSHYDPEQVLARLGQGDIDGVFMVPTHFHRIFALPEATLDAMRGQHALRAIISNAAALPQPTKERIIDYFGDGLLHETYGSTEVGFVTNIRPEDHLRKPNSVGLPFVDMEIELRDEDGNPVADGEPGELFARGPMTFNGYFNKPEETAEAIHDGGWVTVGDMATRDAEGFHFIVDRKKDMVVTGGVNVYPGEVEKVIARQGGVAEVAVVGLADPEWGERIHAFVVAERNARPDEARIIAACRAELAGFKVPRGISIIDELPRNASGKIMKRALREGGAPVSGA